MSPRKPTKPCAACGHGKSKHRVGCCRHQWTTTGQTFVGVGTVVKYCACGGYDVRYLPKTDVLWASPICTEVAMTLTIVPVRFRDACDFVAMHHRHHVPPVTHVFSLGLALDGTLVGVAVVGCPVARAFNDGLTLEVRRSCIAGDVPNGNSMLYGAAWRAAKALGYRRLITYTQAGESGASLRGAGWRVVAERAPRDGWDTPSRRRVGHGVDNVQRYLWEAP